MKKVLQYNPPVDKSNRSVISKSSRLTKKHNEQQNQQLACPYFKRDKVGDKVMERSKRKLEGEKNSIHLDNIERIVLGLMNKHQQAKEKLQKLKEESEREHSRKCPFTPIKNRLERYQVRGDVIHRSEEWLREKRRKVFELKQSVIEEDLRHCTFKPSFESRLSFRPRSVVKSKYREEGRSLEQGLGVKLSMSESILNAESRRDFTNEEYQALRRNLISKLRNTLQ